MTSKIQCTAATCEGCILNNNTLIPALVRVPYRNRFGNTYIAHACRIGGKRAYNSILESKKM